MTSLPRESEIQIRTIQLISTMAPEPTRADDLEGKHRLIEDLGFDSIRLMELTVALERGFALERYTPEQLADIRSVDDVLTLVSTALATQQ